MQVTTLGAYGGPVAVGLYGAPFVNQLTFELQLAGPNSSDFEPPIPEQRCQAFDQGIQVVVQVLDSNSNPVNLRSATGLYILTQRPSGRELATPASFYTNGLDGKMTFSTSSVQPYGAGLNEVGTWTVQGKLTMAGSTVRTSQGSFLVLANLEA